VRRSLNELNITLKLTLMRSESPVFVSTECSSHDGNTSSVPLRTRSTTWSVFAVVSAVTGARMIRPERADRGN
jgi:hypothetical protein